MLLYSRLTQNEKNMKGKKFYIHTFGCQMNENDSEHIASILIAAGAVPSGEMEEAEIVIINTCAVREKSEEKVFSLLGRLQGLKRKKKLTVGITGCVAQLYGSQLVEKKPFVDFVAGPDCYQNLPSLIPLSQQQKVISTEWNKNWSKEYHPLKFRQSKISAYVTIMEGCNNFCSYCIVPFTRGREKYRPFEDILTEIKDVAQRGYKEVILLGQNVNSYLDPRSGKGLPQLLREINSIEGIEWIRFLTSHPKNFTEEIAKVIAEEEKVCRQLHLPLQSGSNSVLKNMNRGYTREDYLKIVSLLREMVPEISLSTDIIVGFPGETDEDFQETLSLVEEIRFSNIFSFRYSPRPLTSASKRKETVSLPEKRRRLIELQDLQKRIQLELHNGLIGKKMKVLCSGKSKKGDGMYSGRNESYQVINFVSRKDVIGEFVEVKITSCGPYSLNGEALNP